MWNTFTCDYMWKAYICELSVTEWREPVRRQIYIYIYKNSQNCYEEKLKCSQNVFNVWLIKILRRSSSSLERFWLFVWKVALKILVSLHKSVSFEFYNKNTCSKPFLSSFNDITREMVCEKYLTKTRCGFVDVTHSDWDVWDIWYKWWTTEAVLPKGLALLVVYIFIYIYSFIKWFKILSLHAYFAYCKMFSGVVEQ